MCPVGIAPVRRASPALPRIDPARIDPESKPVQAATCRERHASLRVSRAPWTCIVCLAASGCANAGYVPRPYAVPPEPPLVSLEKPTGAPIPTTARPDPAAQEEGCPVGIPAARVRVDELRGGGALVFSTDPEHVDELRDRIHRIAHAHREAVSARARGDVDRITFGDETAAIHRATVRSIDTPDGVELVAVSDDPSEVATLREELRADAHDFERGACPLALEIGM